MFKFREAEEHDIPRMQVIRNAVKENVLSDPGRIRNEDYVPYLGAAGKTWLCEWNQTVVGFAAADLQKNNIWALFVHPAFENQGVGKQLHALMLQWYFSTTDQKVWLSTAPASRAEEFYLRQGWTPAGTTPDGEVKFEMTAGQWLEKCACDG